jgi:pimeloyl-[acyl-carrier protein] methyl ester esterase
MKDLALIPGWGFDRRVWQPLIDRLATNFRLRFDLDDLPAGTIVCGWSLGALRALRQAQRQPDAVVRLVLIGATPRFVNAPDWSLGQDADLLAGFTDAVASDPTNTLRRFAALLNQGDHDTRRLTRHLHTLLAEGMPDTTTLMGGLADLRDIDLRQAVAQIPQPTLVLHGERDSLMPLSAGRWLAEHLPNGQLEIVAGAAHAPFLSRPDQVAAALARFAHE